MVFVGLIQEVLGLLGGVLNHFVIGGVSKIAATGDHEWTMTAGGFGLTNKGNYLAGAIADIVTYGAILVDWVVQALLNTGTLTVNAQA
jgi:hypothetical protein